jgi:hypothetical protein
VIFGYCVLALFPTELVHPLLGIYWESLILVGKSKVNLVDGCLQAMLLLLVAITPDIEFTHAIEDFHQGQACFKPSASGNF